MAKAAVNAGDLLWKRGKTAGLSGIAEVVLKQEAVSGGGASMQTGNTLEWRSVASFHKQHHRRVPDIYDLWSERQRSPDSNPSSLHVGPIVTRLNLTPPSLLFSPMKTPDVSYGCQRASRMRTSHFGEAGKGRRGGGVMGKKKKKESL